MTSQRGHTNAILSLILLAAGMQIPAAHSQDAYDPGAIRRNGVPPDRTLPRRAARRP